MGHIWPVFLGKHALPQLLLVDGGCRYLGHHLVKRIKAPRNHHHRGLPRVISAHLPQCPCLRDTQTQQGASVGRTIRRGRGAVWVCHSDVATGGLGAELKFPVWIVSYFRTPRIQTPCLKCHSANLGILPKSHLMPHSPTLCLCSLETQESRGRGVLTVLSVLTPNDSFVTSSHIHGSVCVCVCIAVCACV